MFNGVSQHLSAKTSTNSIFYVNDTQQVPKHKLITNVIASLHQVYFQNEAPLGKVYTIRAMKPDTFEVTEFHDTM